MGLVDPEFCGIRCRISNKKTGIAEECFGFCFHAIFSSPIPYLIRREILAHNPIRAGSHPSVKTLPFRWYCRTISDLIVIIPK